MNLADKINTISKDRSYGNPVIEDVSSGECRGVLERVIKLLSVDENTEVSFSVKIPGSEDPESFIEDINNEFAEGNNFFEHIDDYKLGSKRVITLVYNKKSGNATAWAKKVISIVKKDWGYDADYIIQY